MNIFLYEFVTGGGWYSCGDDSCPDSLLAEARAMVEALASDLMALEGVSLTILADQQRQPPALGRARTIPIETRFEELAAFRDCAKAADWTLLIAPEFAGFLAQRAAMVTKSGGHLLGPSLEVIRCTSDKHATAEWLAQRRVRTPEGVLLERGARPPSSFLYPAVLKPYDGAGSQGVRLIEELSDLGHIEEPSRLERFCPGSAASVLFLCGPRENVPLAPCRQDLSDDGRFRYRGGSLPLSAELAQRAVTLASTAVATFGELSGFVGVDLVLGDAHNGDEDVVIEINPRVTTSYVGLRAAARGNLADAMLQIAEGRPASIAFGPGTVQFDASGRVS